MSKEMIEDYIPRAFWDERCRKYGHTGEADSLLYSYDQPQRLRAIDKALSHSKVRIDADTKILDIGCGTGDFISLFLRKGALDITGIDISDEVISYARGRFVTNRNVKLLAMAAENMDFPADSFDLTTGINVLQHITNREVFPRAIENIVRVVRSGGHILIMDFSPLKVRVRRPASYVTIRSRQEYVQAFENGGCKLICEFGLPRIGVRLCRAISGATAKLIKLLPQSRTRIVKKATTEDEPTKPSLKSRLYNLLLNLITVIVLTLAKPFDYFLVPFPSRYTDMRILLFRKTVK